MGIASLVIGIVAAIVAFIPFCGYLALIPALVGLALGIVDVVLKKKKQAPTGISFAGVILNAVAILIIIVWTLIIGAAAVRTAGTMDDAMKDAMKNAGTNKAPQDTTSK